MENQQAIATIPYPCQLSFKQSDHGSTFLSTADWQSPIDLLPKPDSCSRGLRPSLMFWQDGRWLAVRFDQLARPSNLPKYANIIASLEMVWNVTLPRTAKNNLLRLSAAYRFQRDLYEWLHKKSHRVAVGLGEESAAEDSEFDSDDEVKFSAPPVAAAEILASLTASSPPSLPPSTSTSSTSSPSPPREDRFTQRLPQVRELLATHHFTFDNRKTTIAKLPTHVLARLCRLTNRSLKNSSGIIRVATCEQGEWATLLEVFAMVERNVFRKKSGAIIGDVNISVLEAMWTNFPAPYRRELLGKLLAGGEFDWCALKATVSKKKVQTQMVDQLRSCLKLGDKEELHTRYPDIFTAQVMEDLLANPCVRAKPTTLQKQQMQELQPKERAEYLRALFPPRLKELVERALAAGGGGGV